MTQIRAGAADAEAIVHLANKHDWANPAATNKAERGAVQTMLDVLTGTDRAIIVANGICGLVEGRPATEMDASRAGGPESDRGGSENLTLDYAGRGVRSMVVRFAPSVHGADDWGFVKFLVAAAKERGVSGCIGDESTTWSAVHRADAARLVRLGLESAPAGSRLHAVAEEAVSTRDIAEVIGRSLGLPVESVAREGRPSTSGSSVASSGWTCPRRKHAPENSSVDPVRADVDRGHPGRRLRRRVS